MKVDDNHIMKINELTAGYKDTTVIKDINFNLERGKLICLMGPNGAGKSTLLRCISGLQKYNSGSVSLKDKDFSSYDIAERAKLISIVLTEYFSAAHMTVFELLALGRYPHMSWVLKFSSEDKKIIQEMAERCGVVHLLNKKLHELSDGQRQKSLIARALIQESEIMILDEPTSHLDLNNRVEILNLLKSITREQNKAILMATHELDLALQMADKLLLLNREGNLSEGIPEDLVLNGQLDDVFAFKGYDLKTGKVEHPTSGKKIGLKGDGYIYLWTRNALEREGFIVDNSSESFITISNDGKIVWHYEGNSFFSLEGLLKELKNN
ncbi:MAG: ABC transporter ATP-binding protein [Candidatus Cyclobacteriaceae bacterium M2_1C_046]